MTTRRSSIFAETTQAKAKCLPSATPPGGLLCQQRQGVQPANNADCAAATCNSATAADAVACCTAKAKRNRPGPHHPRHVFLRHRQDLRRRQERRSLCCGGLQLGHAGRHRGVLQRPGQVFKHRRRHRRQTPSAPRHQPAAELTLTYDAATPTSSVLRRRARKTRRPTWRRAARLVLTNGVTVRPTGGGSRRSAAALSTRRRRRRRRRRRHRPTTSPATRGRTISRGRPRTWERPRTPSSAGTTWTFATPSTASATIRRAAPAARAST